MSPVSLRYDLYALDTATATYFRDGYKLEVPTKEARDADAMVLPAVWVTLSKEAPQNDDSPREGDTR